MEDPDRPSGNMIGLGFLDLDHFDAISGDTCLYEFVLGLVSMVSVENDAAIFDIAAGSKALLQLVGESGQVNAISNQVVRLDYGYEPSGMMRLQSDDKMGGFSIKVLQYVAELKILTFCRQRDFIIEGWVESLLPSASRAFEIPVLDGTVNCEQPIG